MVALKFNPGDYIVTKEGLRGYIVQQIEESNTYTVRLVSGYTTINEEDLQKDHLMEGF